MSFYPGGYVVVLLVYLVVAAVLAALAYLVLRFAIRDALRAHTRWLDRRSTGSADGSEGDDDHVS